MPDDKPKSKRGGPRPGSGRPSGSKKAYILKTAKQILMDNKANELWTKRLQDPNPMVSLRAQMFLHEQAFGKATQSVQLSGNPDDATPMAITVDI